MGKWDTTKWKKEKKEKKSKIKTKITARWCVFIIYLLCNVQTRSNPWSHLAALALYYICINTKKKKQTKPTRHHTPGFKWKCSANINELKGKTIQFALAVTQAPNTSAIWIINWYWRQWATSIFDEVSVRVAGIVGFYMVFHFKKWNLKYMCNVQVQCASLFLRG